MNFSVLRSNFATPACSIRPSQMSPFLSKLMSSRPGGKSASTSEPDIGDLAVGIELAEELMAEIGVPGHALVIEDDVMRHRALARQIVFGDHNLGRTPLQPRQGLERIVQDCDSLRLMLAKNSARGRNRSGNVLGAALLALLRLRGVVPGA